MRRGRNTAMGKSILVAGPIHVHKKRELAQNLLDLHFLEACLNKQQQHFEKCCSLYFARILIFKINNVVKLVQKSLASLQENIFLRISNFIPTQPGLRASIYHSFYNIQLDIFAGLTLNFFYELGPMPPSGRRTQTGSSGQDTVWGGYILEKNLEKPTWNHEKPWKPTKNHEKP